MAKMASEFYTGDILDISRDEDRRAQNFEIHSIECTVNEAFECNTIEEIQ
jgi:hypothetical protein